MTASSRSLNKKSKTISITTSDDDKEYKKND